MAASPVWLSRRRLLASTCAALVLAGCSGDSRESSGPTAAGETGGVDSATDTSRSTDAAGEPTADAPTGEPTGTPSLTAADELDLREANVVGVEIERSGDACRFSVTLYHDDDGEDGFADWWQVETFDGDRLGRRTLLHAHSTAPFTRSETITIPDGVTHVVVRGHDQTHGYGGQAMIVALDDGDTEAIRQGPDPRSFAGYDSAV